MDGEVKKDNTPTNVDSVNNSRVYEVLNKTRSWISSALGVIITVIGVAVIFVVASLEGTREIKASKSDSGKLLNEWRASQEVIAGYPEELVDIVSYKDKEYYFVIDSLSEENEIIKWHFAYDGGLEYVFSDYKFYILTALTIAIAMFVSSVNYISTVRSVKRTTEFMGTLKYYQEKKEAVVKFTQLIPDFCAYKNKQVYEATKRDIIEDADINYDFYCSDKFDISKLEEWQLKILNKIKKIKVSKLHSSDLLQESGVVSVKVEQLPTSQQSHQKKFLISGFFQKLVMSGLSGLVVAFGVVFGNWVLGLTYGLTILISYVSSIVVATDFTSTTLRNRYLAKADFLNEFNNIKETFVNKAKELELARVKEEQEALLLEDAKKEYVKPLVEVDTNPIQEKILEYHNLQKQFT